MKALTAEHQIENKEFEAIILKQIGKDVKDNNHLPGVLSIKYLFEFPVAQYGLWVLRSFVVGLYLLKGRYCDKAWFEDHNEPWAAIFLKIITRELTRIKEDSREDENEDYLNIEKIVEKYCFEEAEDMDRDDEVKDKV